MANVPELHLVQSHCGEGCSGAIWTNLDVTSVMKQSDHIESCPVDEYLTYKMEKRAVLTKRSAEETKPIPAIYDEDVSAASSEPSTSGYFPLFKRVKSAMYGHRAKRFPKLSTHRRDLQIPFPFGTTKAGDNFLLWQNASKHILVCATGYNIKLLAAMRTWVMDGTFKIVPQWYQQLFTIPAFVSGKVMPAVYCLCMGKDIGTCGYIFQALIDKAAVLEVDLNPDTIICDFETALIPAIRGYLPNTRVQGFYFYFCQAVHTKICELGLKTRYRQHEETGRKIRMLLATAFLPVPHVNTGVSLLEAGTTSNLLALFQYFRKEWMTDERLPLWDVHNVNIRTNIHLEGWHNRLNRKAAKAHNGLYELLQILIAEQGVMDTLIQQVLSGNATVGDLRRVSKVYAEKQRQVAQYTGEYTNGRRTLEQFIEALILKTGKYSDVDDSAETSSLYMARMGIVRGYCAFLPLLVLWGNKQTVNDKEHIEYIQHILLNTPNRSSVYRYISIDTPCLHTQGTNYRNSLSRRNSLTSSMTKNSEHNANRKLSSNQTSQQQRKE
ncbi:conserved hypothetical protein [Trichinella spiralis]|uniref:hypothetical protein n=1 Tax=Trichinella spiralis TaxID=6334 RepID=UPI0001EFE160|nr:conserved hypothetical protein [Trichinella spiralis]